MVRDNSSMKPSFKYLFNEIRNRMDNLKSQRQTAMENRNDKKVQAFDKKIENLQKRKDKLIIKRAKRNAAKVIKECRRKQKEARQQEKDFKAEIRRMRKLHTATVKEIEKEKRQRQREKVREEKRKVREDLKRRGQAEKEINKKLRQRRENWMDESNRRAMRQFEEENPIVLKFQTNVYKRYRINNLYSRTIESFLDTVRSKVLSVLEINNKVKYTLGFTMAKREIVDGKIVEKIDSQNYYASPNYALVTKDDFALSYDRLVEYFNKHLSELELKGSGWYLKSIDYLDIKLSKYTPMKGSCITTKLPKKLFDNKSIIQIENKDDNYTASNGQFHT